MKTYITLLALFISTQSFAVDLCTTLADESATTTLYSKTIDAETKFTEWEKTQVMTYIEAMEFSYEDRPLETFEDVVAWLVQDSWDELHLSVFRINESEEIITYVWSYPGDNEYGLYLSDLHEVIGAIQDGDLVVGNDYCH